MTSQRDVFNWPIVLKRIRGTDSSCLQVVECRARDSNHRAVNQSLHHLLLLLLVLLLLLYLLRQLYSKQSVRLTGCIPELARRSNTCTTDVAKKKEKKTGIEKKKKRSVARNPAQAAEEQVAALRRLITSKVWNQHAARWHNNNNFMSAPQPHSPTRGDGTCGAALK